MCGISGIINFNQDPVREEKIRKMMRKMKHRGPDDDGVFLEDNVGLGFVRLSILDLSAAGHQPMFSTVVSEKLKVESNRYVIIYNGEVYNYIEIREELKSKGYVFKSNTDTEIVLNSYIEWGEDCLHKFNGMWAFCIFDRKNKELFFARDRYGVKPFYYYLDKNKFIFASEIPPIMEILEHKPQPNNQTIFDYLVFNRTDQTEETFFEGIKKLQHGHSIRLKINDLKFKIIRWYDLKQNSQNCNGFENENDFRELFVDSVKLRLRSDVPVGVSLSGGMDSSSIVAVITKILYKTDLLTFSVNFGSNIKTDETKYIKLFENSVYKMNYIQVNNDYYNKNILNFINAIGEPVSSTGPFAQFAVMDLAKNYVIVLLSGQGADEILAGYKYFWGFRYIELLKTLKIINFLGEFIKSNHKLYNLKTVLYYLTPPYYKTKFKIKSISYINKNFISEYIGKSNIGENLYNSKTLNEALFDHVEYKLEHLLKWEDRNSMYFNLESRVPFLDYRLVEKTISTNSQFKMNNGYTKVILRNALKDILPEVILYRRDKIGFGAPQDIWLKEEKNIKNIIEITYENNFIGNYIIKNNVLKILDEFKKGNTSHSDKIWKIYNLAEWSKNYGL